MIQQKQEACESASKELQDLKRDAERREDSARGSESVIQELRSKLEEAQQTMQSNSSTIQWLNNRLNDAEKTRLPYTSTYKTPSSPALAFKPSTYTMEQFRASPIGAKTSLETPDADFSKLFEPIKYREP